MLFFVFFVGSKSDILGSFGTFLADIGGIFLNELTNYFTSNLLFPFVFLRSIWLTREEFLYQLSFSFTFFFSSKTNTFGRFGTFLAHIGFFFLNQLPNQFWSNWSRFFTFLWSIRPTWGQMLRSPSFFVTFLLVQKVTLLAVLAHFQHVLNDSFRMC